MACWCHWICAEYDVPGVLRRCRDIISGDLENILALLGHHLVVTLFKLFLSICMNNLDGLESLLSVSSTLAVGFERFSES